MPVTVEKFLSGSSSMKLRKLAACTLGFATLVAAAGCAEGTGQALSPTLPTVDANVSNADGTKLKATAPQPLSPRSAIRVSNLTPQLVLENGSGTSAGLSYVFEVLDASSSQVLAKSDPVPAGSSQTTWNVPADVLKNNLTYAWRAFAVFSNVQGSTSDVVSFRTPLPPAPPVPSFEGGATGAVPCAGSGGPSIISCVAAAYPGKLVAKISVPARQANMAFIRDRIIETGLCKGQDFGRNLKRGGPAISYDYLVWRQPGQHDRGVDLASGYDDTSGPLRLTWQVKSGPDYGFPFYSKYPPVDCSAVNP
jgi:hypothetical protein